MISKLLLVKNNLWGLQDPWCFVFDSGYYPGAQSGHDQADATS
jgi:hypothetical protein